MAYVFGLDIPIFEFLFVLMVLLLIGLIFVLFEIRGLKKLLKEESSDIQRFELDLEKIEKSAKPTPELVGHLKKAIDNGYSKDHLKEKLSNAGWNDKSIDGMMEKLEA